MEVSVNYIPQTKDVTKLINDIEKLCNEVKQLNK